MTDRWYRRERERLGRNPLDVMRVQRKAFVVELLGGCCQFCGYRRTLRSLAFHHVGAKAFDLRARDFQYPLQRLLPELQKCVLCCHNCHNEIHEGLHETAAISAHHGQVRQRLEGLVGRTWEDFSLGWRDVNLVDRLDPTKLSGSKRTRRQAAKPPKAPRP